MNPVSAEFRQHVIELLDSEEEKSRKYESYKQWEIYQDRLKQFVIDDLREQYDEQSIREMPIVSSVNLSKRMTNQCSVVYENAPKRVINGVSDDQAEIISSAYDAIRVNKKLNQSNKGYKLQDQSHLWMVVKDGKIKLRVLKNHQVTVIQDPRDPEEAMAYIITAMNKADFADGDDLATATGRQSIIDQRIENRDNYERMSAEEMDTSRLIIVWTKEVNYAMDTKGNIVGDIFENPIEMLPFIDISEEKEYEYWVRQGTGTTDFTVEFNVRLSEAAQVVKMQGFAQAVMKGPREMHAENVRIGPNYLLKLITDPAENIDGDFQYVNPNSDIGGTISWLESLLSLFLSAQGIDPKSVTTKGETQSYTSGLERLLAMIEKISASADDFDVYESVEQRLFELYKAWNNAYSGTEGFNNDAGIIPEDAFIAVTFERPEMVQSEQDRLSNLAMRIEMHLTSAIEAIMEERDVIREDAEQIYLQNLKDMELGLGGFQERNRLDQAGDEPDNQPL